jgi:hypothetical protein
MEEGIFNYGTHWHSITSTLFQGASIVILIAAVVRLFARPGWRVAGINMPLANENLVVLAGVFALVFAVLATLTGIFMTWGVEATTTTSLTINKSMFATFGITALVLMLSMRWRYGPGIWQDPALRAGFVAMAVIQGMVAVVNGSLGGQAGLLGTAFDPVWRLLRIDIAGPMVLPTFGALVLLIVLIAAVLGAVAWRLPRRSVQRSRTT